MKRLLGVAAVLVAATTAFGQVNYAVPSSLYSENFDTLGNSGTNPLTWANNSTLAGWSIFAQPAPGNALTTYRYDDGASNSGAFISYGTAQSSERAFGGLGSGGAYFGSPTSGNIAGWMAVGFTNATGVPLTDFTVGFNGEQWRNGGNTSAQTMVLEYGFGASFTTVGSWTAPGGTFDWASPVTGSTAAAVDGNVAGLVTGRGGTISSLNWLNGDTLWIRWVERNDTGNDHGLAIDNFSFSATPEPTTLALLGVAGLFIRRRRA